MDMKPFEETPMADSVPLVRHLPAGRFADVAKAFRDRDLNADLTKDTVIYRDGREDPPTYGWCYQEQWYHTHHVTGSRGCSVIMFRDGKRKSGKSAYV
jgi:hypothetical protein